MPNRYFLYVCIIAFVLIDNGFAWRHFWKGRNFGGNLGDPVRRHVKQRLPASDQYTDSSIIFEQNLDHFDPTNTATWKQV